MSFSESVFSTRFIQKTVKVDVYVGINCVYPQRNRHQKALDDPGRLHTEAEGQPGWTLGPTVSPRVAMSVLHRLLGCIYAVL
jgi:hypothetical protein